jgi:hypothetical protein
MQTRLTLAAAGLLFTFMSSQAVRGQAVRGQALHAQAANADLATEVAAVRSELARSSSGLLPYTWVEHTEVRVDGDLRSSTDLSIHFDRDGYVVRTPLSANPADNGNGISKRVSQRKKSEKNDYIERAVTLIQEYAPPKPDQIDHMLRSGQASLERGENGASAMRFAGYFQREDSMVFTYDPSTKVLRQVTVATTLGDDKKEPVTLVALFEPLPDGVNHMTSATLRATKKKVEVKRTNVDYRKLN